jgi:hypothetical protein
VIAPLRARHRAMVGALALTLPLGFAAAIGGRVPEAAGPLPEALAEERAELGPVLREVAAASGGRRFELALDRAGVVELAQVSGERAPAVLAYWSAGAPGDELPGDAVLLGSLGEGARRFALPPAAGEGSGTVFVFSLGHGEVLAALPLGG